MKTKFTEPHKKTIYWPKGVAFWKRPAVYARGGELNGKPHGTWTYWYKSGIKQLEGSYLAGVKTGTWTKWRKDGTKATEGPFQDGKMHGRWVDWHVNGQKALESHWYMGRRDGRWTIWTPDGSIDKTVQYDHRVEKDLGYSIHTDLETRRMVREIQRRRLDRIWSGLVGARIAKWVKPWHIACWVLIFVPVLHLMSRRIPEGNAVVLAAVFSAVITGVLAWQFRRN